MIEILGTIFQKNTTYDINILSSNTTGILNIVADRDYIYINPVITNLAVQIDDYSDGSITIGGVIYQGGTYSTNTNVSQQLQRAGPTGVFGTVNVNAITNAGGLTVSIPAGEGYITNGIDTSPEVLTYITWSANRSFAVPDNTLSWIYVNSSGVIQSNGTEPSYIQNIVLGGVRTDKSSVTYIQQVPRNASHMTSMIDQTLRVSIGNLFQSGCLVVPLSSLGLAVTSGVYTYSTVQYTPTGDSITAITMNPYSYNSGSSTWTLNAQITAVPVAYNNTSTGAITALTILQVTKHALYIVGGNASLPTYILVYGQTTYATVADASLGPMPNAPNFFEANVVIIAGIIVQGTDSGTLASNQIIDQRPTLSFSAAAVSTTLDHNSLLNLTVGNAHPQYFRVDGTEPMAGNVNLATNQVQNAGNFVWGADSMNVEYHASRHLPNGVDALTTTTPVTIVSTANSPGISNSFARGDHQHFHGNLSSIDGSSNPLHYLATGSIPGFMSSAQYTLLNGATALDTPSTLVLRDGSGNSAFTSININNGTYILTLDAPGLLYSYTLNMPETTGNNGFVLTTDGGNPTNQSNWTNALIDNVIKFVNNTFNTRFVNFAVNNTANNTTLTLQSIVSTNQTLTFPDATDTLVGQNTTDTLTNKTLTSPVLNGTISGTAVVPIANGGTNSSTALTNNQIMGLIWWCNC